VLTCMYLTVLSAETRVPTGSISAPPIGPCSPLTCQVLAGVPNSMTEKLDHFDHLRDSFAGVIKAHGATPRPDKSAVGSD